ncbi:hypothetical protein [Bacillus safensis]|uniref:hypothetical protein n=1 Tax=Bacillus safensis TaxID=561879 RepID=UPI0022808313|nr:hypothetical protein [Bacillus safensis]MCY7492810.1 hypothetical protein [Bacillus safensis]MED4992609.1 hypothetical protein [Bacillus safensis]
MKFLELTKPNGKKIMINVKKILHFEDPLNETGCRVVTGDTRFIEVVESYDYVQRMVMILSRDRVTK